MKSSKQHKKKGFVRPTPQEVEAYAALIGYKVDGEHFCDYYTANDWCVGKAKTPIKNWKLCVNTWKKRDKIKMQANTPSVPMQTNLTARDLINEFESSRGCSRSGTIPEADATEG
ncbi:MAG: hypothetical protein LLF76_02585 [Planctomycetaceae bacterium]|nr:hypothetical protein [Planctomycetaceae bacterium]